MPKILIIDDNKPVTYADMFKDVGWEVVTASNPKEASATYLDSGACDVVLSDWLMPEGGGARVLRESVHPVLIFSTTPTPASIPSGVLSVAKSCKFERVKAALERLLTT